MSFTKDQLLFLQQILSHEEWEQFYSLGENGRLPHDNEQFVSDLQNILKNHDIYGICTGWGNSASYTRLSFLEENNQKYICIDNSIKISIDGDSVGNLSIMIDDVIYKDFYTNLQDSIIDYQNLKGITKQKFIELLTILNNFRNTVYMTNKLIYNKLFIYQLPVKTANIHQYSILMNDI